MKKNHVRQLTLKKFMLWPKKNSYKEFDNEKNSCGSKIPHPTPHTHKFSNGPSLSYFDFDLRLYDLYDFIFDLRLYEYSLPYLFLREKPWGRTCRAFIIQLPGIFQGKLR